MAASPSIPPARGTIGPCNPSRLCCRPAAILSAQHPPRLTVAPISTGCELTETAITTVAARKQTHLPVQAHRAARPVPRHRRIQVCPHRAYPSLHQVQACPCRAQFQYHPVQVSLPAQANLPVQASLRRAPVFPHRAQVSPCPVPARPHPAIRHSMVRWGR